ncbi:hypothetical protein TWF694_011163 [Orbilia ellipsospora]|uniref:Uncharacterized protein n=1 Tax=Orbilia ellipsospora TaxID=2528407 RepID=A0AAV9X873_9PEZI
MRNRRRIHITLINDSTAVLSFQEMSLQKGTWYGEYHPLDFIDPGYEDGETVGTYDHPFTSVWATQATSPSNMEGYVAYMIGSGGQAFLMIRWCSLYNGEAMCKLKIEGMGKEGYVFKCDYQNENGGEHRFEIRLRNKRC